MYEKEYVSLIEITNLFKCNVANVITICALESKLVSLSHEFYLTDDSDLKLLNTIERELIRLGFKIN